MTNSRRLLVEIVLLASLAACSGKVRQDQPDEGRPGVGGAPSASASAGASGSTGVPCCNLVQSCDAADQTLLDSQCPSGASCYSLEGCCGFVTHCAHFDAPAAVDAGSPSDAGACSLLGSWDTHSAPWKGEPTDAYLTFYADGSFTGAGAAIGAGKFTGSWSLTGSTLTIQNTVGPDMTCSSADDWTLTYSSDCRTAPLLPIGSECTGARRYLDWNVTLTRSVIR